MKYDNLTVNEFINEILNQDIPKLEMYNYVKRATNNFDETSLIYFLQEVGEFGNRLLINVFVEVEDDRGKYYDEERQYSIGSYLTHYMFKLGEENASETQIKIIKEITSTTNVKRKTIAIEVLIPDVEIEGKYWNLIELDNMLESEYQKITNKPSLLPPPKKMDIKQTGLKTFEEIFIVRDWNKYVDILTICEPKLLEKEKKRYKFIGNKKTQRGCVAQWFKFLKSKGLIDRSINRDELAKILTNEILEFQINGSTIDNVSTIYKKVFDDQLRKLFNNIN